MTNVIAKEMTENPMLEELDPNESVQNSDPEMDSIENSAKEAKAENFDEKTIFEQDDFDWKKYVEHFNTNSAQSTPSMVSHDPDDQPNYENMVSSNTSLSDHLLEQIGVENYDKYIFSVAEIIINNLNADGYLEISKEEILTHANVASDQYEEALEIILR